MRFLAAGCGEALQPFFEISDEIGRILEPDRQAQQPVADAVLQPILAADDRVAFQS